MFVSIFLISHTLWKGSWITKNIEETWLVTRNIIAVMSKDHVGKYWQSVRLFLEQEIKKRNLRYIYIWGNGGRDPVQASSEWFEKWLLWLHQRREMCGLEILVALVICLYISVLEFLNRMQSKRE